MNSRTQTEALFGAFQLASGDNHPIHYDREYCKARGHRDLLAHGLQVAIQGAAGAGVFPHVIGDSLIGFLEQSSRFLKPVYCGDTLYPLLEVERAEARPHHGRRHHETHHPQSGRRAGLRRRTQVPCEKAAAPGRTTMIGVIAKLTTKPGINADFEATMKALQGKVQADEPGNKSIPCTRPMTLTCMSCWNATTIRRHWPLTVPLHTSRSSAASSAITSPASPTYR